MSTTLTAIIGSASPAPLSEFAEADLIEQAQLGDHEALLDLMRQYGPVLRRLRGAYSEVLGLEDAEQELMLAFTELVRDHDLNKSPRIAGRISEVLGRKLSEAAAVGASGFTIPARTMSRYLGILKTAEQDVKLARSLAPNYGMTTETFDAVMRANRTDSGVTDEDDGSQSAFNAGSNVTGMFTGNDAEESAELALFALGAVTDVELAVVRRAYGFDPTVIDGATLTPEGAAPLADGLIAASLGLSRPKVQRLRTAALDTMREAVGLVGEEV